MILGTKETLEALDYSCERGTLDIATVIFKDAGSMERYMHNTIIDFLCRKAESEYIENIMMIDKPAFVMDLYIILYKSGSLVFVYTRGEPTEPFRVPCAICTDGDELFDSQLILDVASSYDLMDRLPVWMNNGNGVTDEIDAWLDSLKTIG